MRRISALILMFTVFYPAFNLEKIDSFYKFSATTFCIWINVKLHKKVVESSYVLYEK